MSKPINRISYLDGHRGIAILLVFLFHSYSRWEELVPYGDSYADFPLFRFGHLGVNLFFLISGFVILMTLERCNGPIDFLYRRWIRLFPAMLICSLLVYLTTDFFPERPKGQPELHYLIPGLTLIDPYLLEKLTGISFQNLEGAFWSLYVEFKFYVFSAIAFFLLGGRLFVYLLFCCLILWILLGQLVGISDHSLLSLTYSLTSIAGFEFFGWFSAGAAYYLYVKTDEKGWLYFAIAVSLVSAMVESRLNLAPLAAASAVSILFAASIVSSRLQKFLSNRFLLFLGFISYPFYLIHENMSISIVIKLGNYLPTVPGFLFPYVALIVVCAIAFVIASFIEKPVKVAISRTLAYLAKSLRLGIPVKTQKRDS